MTPEEIRGIRGVGPQSLDEIIRVNAGMPPNEVDGEEEFYAAQIVPDRLAVKVVPDPSMSIVNGIDYSSPEAVKAGFGEGKVFYVVALRPNTAEWLERCAKVHQATHGLDKVNYGLALEQCVRKEAQREPMREADVGPVGETAMAGRAR